MHLTECVLFLELYGRQPAVGIVPTHGVVKHLDLIEDIATRFVAGHVGLMFDALAFQDLEKALGLGAVMAVAASAHITNDAVDLQECLPLLAGELTDLVRVRHQPGQWLSTPDGGQYWLQNQIGLHPVVHGPANDLQRVQIDDLG